MPNQNRLIIPHSKRLRQDMTDAERRLWKELRARRLNGHKLRRQWTLEPYITGFCCWHARLIVEVDGRQHEEQKDAPRTAWLERGGYRVIRFSNNEILGNLQGVFQAFVEALDSPPLPHAGEGE